MFLSVSCYQANTPDWFVSFPRVCGRHGCSDVCQGVFSKTQDAQFEDDTCRFERSQLEVENVSACDDMHNYHKTPI